jgi:DNA (cytosine-5)-methyltransferase 1
VRTLDLFCGGGGSSWGAKAAGAEIVCGVDSWDLATRAYQLNFPGATAVNLTLTETTGPEALGDIGPIDLILASPECTHHTCARGKVERCDRSRGTARYVVNFAHGLRPRWIVIENVIHMKGWAGYQPLLGELRHLGYRVRPVVLDASEFGVPQTRRRMFVLCDRDSAPPIVASRRRKLRTAADIIDRTGTWASNPLWTPRRADATLNRARRAIAELGEGMPFILVYYGSDGAGGWQRLDRPLRTVTTLDRFGLVTWDGDTPMFRMLQVPELMRAMGFSMSRMRDSTTYTLDGIRQRRDRIKLLGNGVCPPVMQAIVSALTRPAARELGLKEQDAVQRQREFAFAAGC